MREIEKPTVGNGEVRIQIQYIGLNYAEIQSRKGVYQWSPELPYTLGMEGYGIVDAVGENVTHLHVGDPVMVVNQYGCYAEYITVPAAQALPAIPDFSPEENASLPVSFMTAWVALMELARLKETDTVLIHAASGGLGTAAVQIAKQSGCTVIGTVGRDEKMSLAQDLGCDLVINYRKEDFREVVMDWTKGSGVDIVLEIVGGHIFRESLKCLNPFGRLVVMGFASLNLKKWNPLSWYQTWKDMPKVNVSNLAVHSSGILASHLGYLLQDPRRLMKMWTKLTAFIKENEIKPIVGHVFDFEDIPKAHQFMESRQSQGKIVIRVQYN